MKCSNIFSQMFEPKRTQPPHNNYSADGTLYIILVVVVMVWWCDVAWSGGGVLG